MDGWTDRQTDKGMITEGYSIFDVGPKIFKLQPFM